MTPHNLSLIAQIVTALTMASGALTVLFKWGSVMARIGKWFMNLIEATEKNTRTMADMRSDMQTLSVRLSAVEAKLGMQGALTNGGAPLVTITEHHDTPYTQAD
jgi:hypothetical protein